MHESHGDEATHCLGRYIKENEMICGKDYDFRYIYIPDNWFMQKNKCFDDVFWRYHHFKILYYAKKHCFQQPKVYKMTFSLQF